MQQPVPLKPATSRTRKPQLVKKSRNLRVIAQLPFRGTLSVKVVDAAIKAVMAKRDADAWRAVQIELSGDSGETVAADNK